MENSRRRLAICGCSCRLWWRGLLSLEICGPDDRPPLLDLRLVKGRESFQCLQLSTWNVLSQLSKPLSYPCIAERAANSGIELRQERLGSVFRRPHAGPDRNVQPGQTGLVDCRNLGRRRQAR